MPTYFVGPGGNDGNSGLTWALRKLTLNGAEDVPVVAGDTVYVGPGVYREQLTIDVSGGAGTPITYIADVTGRQTDDVGGIVRVTGSDNDQTSARNNCITIPGASPARHYRTFRGFRFDGATNEAIYTHDSTDWIIEDCIIADCAGEGIEIYGAGQANHIYRRCVFTGIGNEGILFNHAATVSNAGHLVENCLFVSGGWGGVKDNRIGGITIRNCSFITGYNAIEVGAALAGGQTVTVNNCLMRTIRGLVATAIGEITENYNNVLCSWQNRVNTNTGANSTAYYNFVNLSPLLDSYRFPPPLLGELSEWSALGQITGTGPATDDLFGFTRPTTGTKKSWGALQFQNMERNTGTVYASSTASLELPDAGIVQFIVPVDPVETTIQVRVNRQANYAGNTPRMTIREPGQSDRNSPDPGAASVWNLLTDTFTPTGDTDFVTVLLQSRNTAIAGNYAVFFDDLFVR